MKSQRTYALTAGLSLIAMAILAGYAYGFAHSTLFTPSDPEQTLSNLQQTKGLFVGELIGWVVIFLLDIIVAWTLYVFLKEVHQKLSGLAAFFRFVYTGFLGFAIWQLVEIMPLIDTSSTDLIIAQFESFESIWTMGLILFGAHLILLGLLSFRTSTIPSIFGWLLLVAGVSYVLVPCAEMLFPMYLEEIALLEMILSLPMAMGELAFAVWLVWRGGKR